MILKKKGTPLKNKLISAVLSGVLLANSTLFAASSMGDIIKDSQSTGTSVWTDDSGTTFYSGGHVSYRFKSNTSFPLIFDAEAPGIKIGCDGFDLNGGFVSILGWDKIQDQLSEAGTSVLYGAVLILVSSTPILGDVVDKIQKWSRLIQKILQNSCEMTKNLGRGVVGGAVSDKIMDSILNSDAASKYNDAMSGIDTQYEAIDDWVDKAANGSDEQVAALLAPLFGKSTAPKEYALKDVSSVGVTAPILNASLEIKADKNFLIMNDAVSLLNGVGQLVKLKTGESKNTVEAKLFWGEFLFGDFVVKQESISSLTRIATTNGTLSKEKISALAKATIKSADSLLLHPEYKLIAPRFRNNIVEMFIDGFGALNNNSNNVVISVPSFSTLIYNIELQKLDEAENGHSATGTGNYIKGVISMDTSASTGQKYITFSWKGYDAVVNSKLYKLIDTNTTQITDNSVTPLNPFTDTGSYIKVLRRYYNANHGQHQQEAGVEIRTLGKAISYYNAKALYMMVRAAIMDKVYGNKDKNGVSVGGDKLVQFIKIVNYYDKLYLKQFAKYADENKIISQSEMTKKIREIKQMLDRDLKQHRFK